MAGPVVGLATGVFVDVGDGDPGSTARPHQGTLLPKQSMLQGKDFAGLGK
jgi:hypothetical protein